MIKKSLFIVSLLLVSILLLSSCSPAATPTAQIVPVTVTPPEEKATQSPQEEAGQVQITIQDALDRTVTLDKAPERIVLAGKAVIMVTDAVYALPGASSQIVGISNTNQGRGDFISILDPNYASKVTLANDVGPEQVAALQPDLVILKSYLAESLGSPLETLGIPVVYLNLETPEQYSTDLLERLLFRRPGLGESLVEHSPVVIAWLKRARPKARVRLLTLLGKLPASVEPFLEIVAKLAVGAAKSVREAAALVLDAAPAAAATAQAGATWGLDRIDQRALPLNGTYVYNADGAGGHAYIIDTGVRASHGQFTGRMGNGYTAITTDSNGTNDCKPHGRTGSPNPRWRRWATRLICACSYAR